jgi:pimeloyl-ACP methyl ester carboxylesterase
MSSRCPIALLAGTEDKFLRNEFYGKLPMDRFWKKRVVWFKGCGHALNLENRPLFEQTISEFMGAEPITMSSTSNDHQFASSIT